MCKGSAFGVGGFITILRWIFFLAVVFHFHFLGQQIPHERHNELTGIEYLRLSASQLHFTGNRQIKMLQKRSHRENYRTINTFSIQTRVKTLNINPILAA